MLVNHSLSSLLVFLSVIRTAVAVPHFTPSPSPPPSPPPPKVKVGRTTLTGSAIPLLGQEFFGGIPYAEPPLGSLRFRPPVLKTQVDGSTFDARAFGKGCLQSHGDLTTLSEDCLTINVFRPVGGCGRGAKLPVMFWTYGGGFDAGASSSFNGSAIVAQSVKRGTPIIYVSFNYRLGPLGYPQGQEADNKGALNLALKDELAALEWVQANIAAFGGDPRKVTAFGESAGAIMTAVLVLNSGFERLARAAIFESGSAATALEFPASHREQDWQNFVSGVASCASIATSGNTFGCLEKASEAEILQGVITGLGEVKELFGYDPTIDGNGGVFPDIASRLIEQGNFAKIPFITGTNLDEGTLFTPTSNASLTDDAIKAAILASYSPTLQGIRTEVLSDTADKLLALYPDNPVVGAPYGTGNQTFGLLSGYKRLAALNGDLSFDSQRRYWIQAASKAGVDTYGYLFTQPQPANKPTLGVSHGSEVNFVFGAVTDPAPSAQQLSAMMIDYWISFAVTLDPNDGRGNRRPKWVQYTPRNNILLELNGANTVMIPDDYRKEQIAFINSDPTVFHHRRRALKFVH